MPRPRTLPRGYAADWTMEQLRDAAQRIADRIDELIFGTGTVNSLQNNKLAN